MTAPEIASAYNVSLRTAKRYRKAGAPVDDPAAMKVWIAGHRSRLGVGKYTPRNSESATVAPVRAIVAEIVPTEPAPADPEPEDEGSTLQRLGQAERTAYQRDIDSGGNERVAQVWLLVCDQKRKLIAEQQKHAADVSESETKFMATCAEVIDTLWLHLDTAPKLLGLLCEHLDRDAIEQKIADQLRRTVGYAVASLADQLRGTSLERLLPR